MHHVRLRNGWDETGKLTLSSFVNSNASTALASRPFAIIGSKAACSAQVLKASHPNQHSSIGGNSLSILSTACKQWRRHDKGPPPSPQCHHHPTDHHIWLSKNAGQGSSLSISIPSSLAHCHLISHIAASLAWLLLLLNTNRASCWPPSLLYFTLFTFLHAGSFLFSHCSRCNSRILGFQIFRV